MAAGTACAPTCSARVTSGPACGTWPRPASRIGPRAADGWPVPPIGRVGQAGDVAAAAVFYASDQAEFITGTTLLVDGGMTAGYLQRER